MLRNLVLVSCAAATALIAQENPLTASFKMQFGISKNNITKAAEKMPEDNYGFKPSDDVRSFGQLLGHVADAQYLFCAPILGDKAEPREIEKTKTSKTDLAKALKDAFAYCDKAFDAMTDAQGAQTVKFFGRDVPKLGVLAFNNMHNYEHYGNIVTYMRMKKLVPPSSERNP